MIWIGDIDFSFYGGAESLKEGRSPRRTTIVSPAFKDDRKSHFGPPQDPKDFLWLMTEEPHRTRRMAIIKAHPEVSIVILTSRTLSIIKLPLPKRLPSWWGMNLSPNMLYSVSSLFNCSLLSGCVTPSLFLHSFCFVRTPSGVLPTTTSFWLFTRSPIIWRLRGSKRIRWFLSLPTFR